MPGGAPAYDDVAECLDYDVVRQGIMALQRLSITIYRKFWHGALPIMCWILMKLLPPKLPPPSPMLTPIAMRFLIIWRWGGMTPKIGLCLGGGR